MLTAALSALPLIILMLGAAMITPTKAFSQSPPTLTTKLDACAAVGAVAPLTTLLTYTPTADPTVVGARINFNPANAGTQVLGATAVYSGSTLLFYTGELFGSIPGFPAEVSWRSISLSSPTAGTDSLQISGYLQWATATYIYAEPFSLYAQVGGCDSLLVISPFLLGSTADLRNLDLAAILPSLPNPTVASAGGLVADGTSAAIVLYSTSVADDVTFTTTNGTSLLPYNSAFLTAKPAAGLGTVTVSAESLTKVGSLYYAVALVQAPITGTSFSFVIPAHITAKRAGAQIKSTNIPLVPPPVVLVHGLWGDRASLKEVETYLLGQAPWQAQGLVEPICYSKFMAFDAAQDPLDPVGCETTSAKALRVKVDSLNNLLDTRHIVGGRVDIVAHSMGGLVARNYASITGYRTPRNRQQGDIHEIITLNTPEAGSPLAPFLLSVAGDKRQRSAANPLAAIWEAKCGTSSMTTVEGCFAANDMALTGPGLSLCSGAVYSLTPAGQTFPGCPAPSLNRSGLLPPNFPDVIWKAISSDAPTNSAVEAAINGILTAIGDKTFTPPTISKIMGGEPNDAIVLLTSQIAGAAGGQFYIFSNPPLSHTSLLPGWNALIKGHGWNDDSVLSDPSGEVNTLVGCWLKGASGPDLTNGCLPAAAVGPPSAGPALISKPTSRQSRIVSRITVQNPGPQHLATPFDLPIQIWELRSSEGMAISVTQWNGGESLDAVQSGNVQKIVGDTAYIGVIPKLLGLVEFDVTASFDDGGIDHKRITLDIEYPPGSPEIFQADDDPEIALTLEPIGSEYTLHSQAKFAGLPEKIDLDGRSVAYRLVPSAGEAPVRVSSGGFVQALRVGKATIEAQFGAAVAQVGVTVLREKP